MPGPPGRLTSWATAAIVVAGLWFARGVLIPITLSIFLSFLLAPIVAGLRRIRFGRVPSVLLAVALALGAIAVTGTVIASQAQTIADDAPGYVIKIVERANGVRDSLERRFAFLTRESSGSSNEHRRAQRARLQGARSSTRAVAIPVEVHNPPPTAIQEIMAVIVPVIGPIETALIVLVVTVFILLQKEDLRDRLIRLMGAADLHRTTIALDDGGKRLSRYFLSQFAVNCAFGAIIWGGLFLIGLPSPGLWGILAGLLRFVPYVGTLIGALAPLILSTAIDPGWTMTISVALLFIIIEPLVGYVVEPFLAGRSTGLSPVSVVVAAIFWTWLWGPVGLILAMPLTLMLVVLGRHLPAFSVFDVLLGDRPALSPIETFYQRATAGHPEEAIDLGEDLLEETSLARYFDDVVLGALRLAAKDLDRGAVSRSAMVAVCDTTIEVVAAFADHKDNVIGGAHLMPLPGPENDTPQDSASISLSILCIPARGPLDRAVSAMLVQMLTRRGANVREADRDGLRRPDLANLDLTGFDVLCVTGLLDERILQRFIPLREQLEAAWPGVKLIMGVRRTIEDEIEGAADPLATEYDLPATLSEMCQALADLQAKAASAKTPA
jgi:predicted PurR-regulated permease PerM